MRGRLAPRAGFEPATRRLTAGCSTAELSGNGCGAGAIRDPWRGRLSIASGQKALKASLFSHHFWYRGSRMSHEQTTSTDDHRNVEGMWSEQLGSSPAFGHRPPDRQTLGGPRAAALGLRALAGGAAPVYSSQTAEAGAVGGGGRPGTGVARSDGLLSGEAGGVGPGPGAGGLRVDHSSVSAAGGLGPPQYEATAPPFPERPSHATP